MFLPHPSVQSNALLLVLLLLPSLHSCCTDYSQDFGRIVKNSPRLVLKPENPNDIARLLKSNGNNLTVAARGVGHSTYGQSQALGGIVIDMHSMPGSVQIGKGRDGAFADVSGGALWVDVLKETLKHGLSPRSLTDYLYLTVGGTLSVGGIGGQAFKFGPLIANVLEMDVITAKGKLISCSRSKNSDLFHGVLGGLGQFGIITRARIILQPAPKMVKLVRVLYNDFNQFTKDQELLIYKGEVDYLQGFMDFNRSSNATAKSRRLEPFYIIQFAMYYDKDRDTEKRLERIVSQLSILPATMVVANVSYFSFLNRVKDEELNLRKKGLWEVAHPWVDLFVPKSQVGRVKNLLVETLPQTETLYGGLMLMYPTLRKKWSLNTSLVLPQEENPEDIMYLVTMLRAAPSNCTSGSSCLSVMLSQNEHIVSTATATTEGGMEAKQYMPHLKNENEWAAHFGGAWEKFKQLKSRYDPLKVLSPGQRIFNRITKSSHI